MELISKSKKALALLSGLFFFEGVTASAVKETLENNGCECVRFEPNEWIYTRDIYRRSIGVVLSGEVVAVKNEGDGAGVLMNTFGPGGVFGVAALFNDSYRYVTDISAIKKSELLFLSETLLKELFEKEPRTALNYISYLTGRICYLNSRIDSFAGGSAESRLTLYLAELMHSHPGRCEVVLPCTMSELAGILGIGRASLYRAMESLETSGVLSRSGRRITLLKGDYFKGSV